MSPLVGHVETWAMLNIQLIYCCNRYTYCSTSAVNFTDYYILVTACLCNTCDSMPICNKWSYSLTCQNSITITTLLGLIHQSYTYYESGKVLCLWVELPCSTGGLLSNQLNTLLNTACGRKSTMWCHMLIFIHAWIRLTVNHHHKWIWNEIVLWFIPNLISQHCTITIATVLSL